MSNYCLRASGTLTTQGSKHLKVLTISLMYYSLFTILYDCQMQGNNYDLMMARRQTSNQLGNPRKSVSAKKDVLSIDIVNYDSRTMYS